MREKIATQVTSSSHDKLEMGFRWSCHILKPLLSFADPYNPLSSTPCHVLLLKAILTESPISTIAARRKVRISFFFR